MYPSPVLPESPTPRTLKLFGAAVAAALPAAAWALDLVNETGLNEAANFGGVPTGVSIYQVVGNIIRYALGLLGALFLILVIRGGLMWMTSGGDQEKLKHARQLITNSSIGLAIVLVAYAITTFVVNTVTRATLPS